MLLLFVTAGLVGAVDAAIHNPKSECVDVNGEVSKTCHPTGCGCLFHVIEEFFTDIFE